MFFRDGLAPLFHCHSHQKLEELRPVESLNLSFGTLKTGQTTDQFQSYLSLGDSLRFKTQLLYKFLKSMLRDGVNTTNIRVIIRKVVINLLEEIVIFLQNVL